jgi:hypothetical protein
VHYHGGERHRLPKDWLLPRTGVLDVWRQWWIGNSIRKVPPLRMLGPRDFHFLNKICMDGQVALKGVDETHKRVGMI